MYQKNTVIMFTPLNETFFLFVKRWMNEKMHTNRFAVDMKSYLNTNKKFSRKILTIFWKMLDNQRLYCRKILTHPFF